MDYVTWYPSAVVSPRRRRDPSAGDARMRSVRLACLALALGALLLAGCGGGGGGPTTPQGTGTGMAVVTLPNTVPHNTAPPPASASDEQVIRLWADTLRQGDVAGAAGMFGLPAVTQIQPGDPIVELRTRAQARAFNTSLTCGAVLLRTERYHGLTVGVFRLSERPGGSCGSGAGAIARTGFVIEDGRITHWIRLPNEPEDNQTPQTPQPRTPPDDEPPPLV
jgi:hypothetical protein